MTAQPVGVRIGFQPPPERGDGILKPANAGIELAQPDIVALRKL